MNLNIISLQTSLSGALRRRGLQRAFPDGRISYPGIGIISGSEASVRNTITAVIDGTPAQQAGLRPGDEVVTADDTAFEPIGSFRGKVSKTVLLKVHRGGSDLQISIVPVDLEPTKMFLRGLESSARIIESNGRRIGYSETSKLNTPRPLSQMATISECRYRWLRVPDLNLSTGLRCAADPFDCRPHRGAQSASAAT
jgi:C-terminal processing protease CtpA/Prc